MAAAHGMKTCLLLLELIKKFAIWMLIKLHGSCSWHETLLAFARAHHKVCHLDMHCRAITAESYGQGILPLHLFLGGGRSCESTYEQGSGVGLKEKSMVASYMVLFSTLGIASWLSWSTALG
eukprot:scaffold277918_cov15-Tisochrysis_lutea.AAC.1